MKSAADAKKLLNRSILIKEVIELRFHWRKYHTPYLKTSFKFNVTAFGSSLTIPQQVERIERFSFLPYDGDIDLKNPDVVFSLYEDYNDFPNQGLPVPDAPIRLFWGPFVAESSRALIQQYDLKKRGYLGTTSMDAELSLIMSNVALARPGSLVLDPFVGTGSFLVTSSHFGAYTIGSDIDGRQIRGKGNGKSIESNAKQYSLEDRILGTVVCDIAHHPWRDCELWDAIVCDPPYGVRAGAKKIAVNPKAPPKTSIYNRDGGYKLPQCVPYELDDVMADLISFAAKFLVPGGRLVYWLPTLTDSYSPKDVPRHKRLRLLDNCEQSFNKWARRMIIMEKLKADEPDLDLDALLIEIEKGMQTKVALDEKDMKVQGDGLVTLIDNPAHAGFRKGYFKE
ncbi:tRNA guanosine-2'-O-methyltransferase [Rhizoclosmatium globosum]|uniref:tRNA (guanine(10)-N(2))-methyltransferase n=1 Tax=Rhizoclosmatium globosum TaxID=329046 RepID=A0A1Y2B7Z0_9FUNG|nr:tRNA guanosine-2'-O-methyltransferase [Rhizoclosmatium globosum]|eukprot:ORY30943.1 tRNA guanosine-2'-O-methyltransferase [Rhizoclosmatium globosum]